MHRILWAGVVAIGVRNEFIPHEVEHERQTNSNDDTAFGRNSYLMAALVVNSHFGQ